MSQVNSPHTYHKLRGPILSGWVPQDHVLWQLSLVLLEIAQKQQAISGKEEQHQTTDNTPHKQSGQIP